METQQNTDCQERCKHFVKTCTEKSLLEETNKVEKVTYNFGVKSALLMPLPKTALVQSQDLLLVRREWREGDIWCYVTDLAALMG